MISLEGCTKRSVRNPGRSPGVNVAEQLPGRQYLASIEFRTLHHHETAPCCVFAYDEVLPARQPYRHFLPRTSSPVTTASLSTAFQAGRLPHLFYCSLLSTAIASLQSATVGSRLVVGHATGYDRTESRYVFGYTSLSDKVMFLFIHYI